MHDRADVVGADRGGQIQASEVAVGVLRVRCVDFENDITVGTLVFVEEPQGVAEFVDNSASTAARRKPDFLKNRPWKPPGVGRTRALGRGGGEDEAHKGLDAGAEAVWRSARHARSASQDPDVRPGGIPGGSRAGDDCRQGKKSRAGYEGSTLVRFIEPMEPIYYFSDELGCPRGTFARSETMFLSGWMAGSGFLPDELLFFLKQSGCPPHYDVRTEPQEIYLAPWSQKFTQPIGSRCVLGCGELTGMVRPSLDAICKAEPTACGVLRCDLNAADIEVHAVDPQFLAISIKSQGSVSRDWDDGRCDSCGSGE